MAGIAGKGKLEKRPAGWGNILENLFVVILAFYPLRHIYQGIDLWDTGYNYANFTYMGLEHMDPMWLFSTWLSNAAGHLLTMLPRGMSLVGMNFYTGLFASLLALLGYWFCTRRLKQQAGIVFLGELIALSLCWCPTALLYNYMTYVLFLVGVILLYQGLTKENRICLIGAGVCLGANVLVRFPNLVQAAMILAVWVYDFIVWREETPRKGSRPGRIDGRSRASGLEEEVFPGGRKRLQKGKALQEEKEGARSGEGFWRRTLAHTLWCLLGYAGALILLVGCLSVRYGLREYIDGIGRLFAMTDTASDYKAVSMLRGIVDTYVENLYWAARIGVIVLAGLVLFVMPAEKHSRICRVLTGCVRSLPGIAALGVVICQKSYFWEIAGVGRIPHPFLLFACLSLLTVIVGELCRSKQKIYKITHGILRCLWISAGAAMLGWLYYRGFCSLEFYTYGSMLRPGILFLMLTMLIAAIHILHPGSGRQEKLIGGMLILVILLTSIGSNNGVYPSLNNLFVAAPYTLCESWRFLRRAGAKKITCVMIDPFPAKCILASFLLMCFFQFGCFGMKFVFAEATGIQEAVALVEDNEVLKGVRMPADKAAWMGELNDYVRENGLTGQEVILYGNIPALSYYLQMPSAFNPWSDLRSYGCEVMEEELRALNGETPVIILENRCVSFLEGGRGALEELNLTEEETRKIVSDAKLALLEGFLQENSYEQVFRNEKFALYRCLK